MGAYENTPLDDAHPGQVVDNIDLFLKQAGYDKTNRDPLRHYLANQMIAERWGTFLTGIAGRMSEGIDMVGGRVEASKVDMINNAKALADFKAGNTIKVNPNTGVYNLWQLDSLLNHLTIPQHYAEEMPTPRGYNQPRQTPQNTSYNIP